MNFPVFSQLAGNFGFPETGSLETASSSGESVAKGEPRKASQRRARPAAPSKVYVIPVWRTGDKVRWRDRIGDFRRETGDGEHAEITISERTYRVRLADLA